MGRLELQSNGPLCSSTVAVDEWAVTFGTTRRVPSLLYQNVTVRPSTASVLTFILFAVAL